MAYFWVMVGLASFLLAFGVVFLLLAKREAARGVFLAFALLYFALAHLSIVTGLGSAVDDYDRPPCEWRLNWTREAYTYGDNYSSYHWDYQSDPPSCSPNNLDCVNLFHVNKTYQWYNTCSEYDNASASTMFTIMLWTMWADFFALFLGMSVLMVQWVRKRW